MKYSLNRYLQEYLAHIDRVGIPHHVAHEEGYKFRAVDTFQRNFDLDAASLEIMLSKAIEPTNLVAGSFYFPRGVLLGLARLYPEEVRTILRNLFDQLKPVGVRIDETENAFKDLHSRWRGEGGKGDHTFIELRFLSLLLALQYPEHHNPMKPREWRLFCQETAEGFRLEKHMTSGQKYVAMSECVERLREVIIEKPEMIAVKEALTSDLAFKDISWRWTTQDVIYVTARILAGKRAGEQAIIDEPLIDDNEIFSEGTEGVKEEIEHHTGSILEFPLERDLEQFIIKNWRGIDFGEKLDLYRDEDGVIGQQYVTDVGIIDLLAIDENGDFVVLELKRGAAGFSVVGQILAYIDWVEKNLAEPNQKVRGIIVANSNAALRAAHAQIADKVRLCSYKISMSFV